MRRILVLAIACALSSNAIAQDYDRALLGAGKILYMRCIACHTITKNGRDLVGPNLWGIFGNKAGSRKTFKGYSASLMKSDIVWSRDELDGFVENPAVYLPGTNMVYKGLPKETDRNALLAYMEVESAKSVAQFESFRY